MYSTYKDKIQRLIRNDLNKKSLFDNAISLTAGNAIAQGLTFAASPILSRMFSSESFGVFGIYIAILTLVTTVITLRFDFAALLPADSESASRLALISILATLLFSTFYFTLLWTGVLPSLLVGTKGKELIPFLVPLGINILLLATYSAFNVWAMRANEYRHLAKANISNNGLTGISQVALGFAGYPAGLYWGQILARIFALSFLAFGVKNTFRKSKIRWVDFKSDATKYSSFALLNGLGAVLDAVILYLPTAFFFSYFSAQAAGYYFLANKVISAIPMMISNSTGNALRSRLSKERFGHEEIKRSIQLSFQKLFGFAALLLPFLLIIVYSFSFIFGKNWAAASEFCFVLIFPAILTILATPFTTYLFCNDNFAHVLWRVGFLSLKILIMYYAISTESSVLTSVIYISSADCILYLSYLLFVSKRVGFFENSKAKNEHRSAR